MKHPCRPLPFQLAPRRAHDNPRQRLRLPWLERFRVHHVGHNPDAQPVHPIRHGLPQVFGHGTHHVHALHHILDGPSAPPRPPLGLMEGRPMLCQHHGNLPALRPSHRSAPCRVGHMKVHDIRHFFHLHGFSRHRSSHPQELRFGRLVVKPFHLPHPAIHVPNFLPILFPHLHHRSPRSFHRHRRPNLTIVYRRHSLHMSFDEVAQAPVDLRRKPAGNVQNLQALGHASKVGKNEQTNVLGCFDIASS